MPTFFSKILNLGKDKDKKGDSGTKEPQSPTSPKHGKRHSIHSLLEGKFEAVSPTVSEQGENAAKEQQEVKGAADPESDKEKDKLVNLLSRPKARTKSPTRRSDDFPRLTLNLTLPSMSEGEKKGGARELRTVLEGTVDGAPLLDDATLGKTRLSPPEALKLMKACAGAINERGLDTLGVMHPHWHSASPQLQRRLISLFMASIGQSASPKAQSIFQDGMEFTRSPHDIASVFRWALRHLQLEGHSFASAKDVEASTTGPLSWYGSFVDDERTGNYPPTALSTILLPRVKAPHVELLLLTTDLMSVLAAHSEANGVSGSKLSMILGQYLLIGSQESGEVSWKDFYERWENSGRALEHIFLCYLRDETSKGKIPKRVQELVAGYPYSKYAIEGDSRFPRAARFATRSYDALHVLITCEVPQQSKFREENACPLPLSVIENALKSGASDDAKELEQTWSRIQALANTTGEEEELLEGKAQDQRNLLSRVLSDESIRLLGLRSDDAERVNKNTPTITMFSHVPGEARVYSKSHSSTNGTDVPNGKGKESVNGISRNASETTATSTTLGGPTPVSPIASGWSAFSSSGFGEDVVGSSLASTLMDSDVEKTQPSALESRRSLKKSGSKGHKGERAKSRERVGRRTNVTPLAASEAPTRESVLKVPSWKTASVSIVKLDEAFVDFWADALLDPIARPWPTFVVCQLKSNVNAEVGEGQKISWLVVEQAFVAPPPPPTPPVEEVLAQRASSPKPSIASETKRPGAVGRVSSTFKRFALFGSGTSYSDEKDGGKKAGKGIRVGEMGEIIHEEATSPPMSPLPTASNKAGKRESALKEGPSDKEVAAAAAAVAVGGVAVASTLNQVAEALKPEPESKVESTAPATEEAVPNQSTLPIAEPESTNAAEVAAPPTEEPISQTAVESKPLVETDGAQVSASAEDVTPSAAAVTGEVLVGTEVAQGLSKEQELAEASATDALTKPPTTDAVVEAGEPGELSQPERQIVGDESAVETTPAPASEAVVEPSRPRSPGAGDSRFVEHLESTPDIAEHAAPLDTVDEVAEGAVAEKAVEVPAPAEPAKVDAPVPEVVAHEQAETKVEDSVVEAVEVPAAPAESSAEPVEHLHTDEPMLEEPVVVEAVAEESVQETALVSEPAAEEHLVAEAPVAEAPPVVEDLVVAEAEAPSVEPAVETVTVEEHAAIVPTIDEPASVESVPEAHDVADVPKVEEPAAQELAVEEPAAAVVEEPQAENPNAVEQVADVPPTEVAQAEGVSIPEPTSDEPMAEAPAEEHATEAPEESVSTEEAAPAEVPVAAEPEVSQAQVEATDEAPVEEPAPTDPVVEEPSQVVAPAEEQVPEEAAVSQAEVEQTQIAEEVPVVEEPAIEEPTTEESIVEAPVAEEPVIEKPAEDAPAAEAPAIEEPVVEAPATEEPLIEASVPEEEPTIQEVIVEPEQQVVEEASSDEPAAETTQVPEPDEEAPIVEHAVPEVQPIAESVTEASVPSEPAVEAHATEEHVAETAVDEPAAAEVPAVAEPTVEEPTVEAPVIAEAPTTEEPTVETPATEEPPHEATAAVEEHTVEAQPVEEPAETTPVDSAPVHVAEDPIAEDSPALDLAVEEAPAETADAVETHSIAKAESAPDLGQVSPPVVAGEVETTVQPEVPIIEDITSGPSPVDIVEPTAPVEDVPSNDEPTTVTEATGPSEHVESEPAQSENGAAVEATKEASDDVPPLDAAEPEPTEPAVIEPSTEAVPDEAETS